MPVYNDILTPLGDTEVLARFAGSYYAGEAALTKRRFGKGRVLQLGGTFTVESTRLILQHLDLLAPMQTLIEAPPETELVMRRKGSSRWLFALNYQPVPAVLRLKKPLVSLLDDMQYSGSVTLAPYGVQVWKAD